MSDKVYQIITDRIIGMLEKGVVPWHKPWAGVDSMPKNLVSGKEYRGVNVFLLGSLGYQRPEFVSYKQAGELGGQVRAGEKGCPVVFWKMLQGEEINVKTGKPELIPLLRYYTVFNVAQCDGLEGKLPALPEGKQHEPIKEAEAVVASMPSKPPVKTGNARAYYSPAEDYVAMPDLGAFESPEAYYDTLFHELTHATGHASRLNRKGIAATDGERSRFGSAPYAREELVAEMGAAFLCGHVGIVDRVIDNEAGYIKSWLDRLNGDPKLVVVAAAQAQKAADFILGVKHETPAPVTA